MIPESESKYAFLLKEPAVDKEPETESDPAASSRGRRSGKRRDPSFEQVTAYIRRDTHHEVKLALLKEGRNRQFSELVETLLTAWLAKTTQQPELPSA